MDDDIRSKDALAVNLWVLWFNGAWSADISSPKLRILYHIYGAVVMSFLSLTYFMTEIIYVAKIWGDLGGIIETLFLLLTHMANTVKLANLLLRRKRIEKLVADLYQDIFLPKNNHHRNFIRATIKRANRDNILFSLMCTSTVMAWAIVPLMERNKPRRLPLKGWFPFDTMVSPNFEMIYLYQVVAAQLNAVVHAMLDTFASVFMALAGSQLDMLRYDLLNLNGKNESSAVMPETGGMKNIKSKSTTVVVKKFHGNKVKELRDRTPNDNGSDILAKKFGGASKDDILHERIVGCIEHHRAIIRFAREIQDVFGIGILAQFGVSSIILCLTCFELTLISPTSLQFHSMLLYQGCMLFQIYCYCWHGNGIIVKTSELMTAAFHSDWPSCSPKFKKSLRIMMCRMQRPMKLMVGGILSLSLETFSMILRSAYSFYALLQRVHNDKN